MKATRLFLSSAACTALIPGTARPQSTNPSGGNPGSRPHIILIVTDQHRADALGCVNESVITPHLDRLASEGNLFVNAYSATPSSTPARSGLLTGMTPWHHGMLGYGVVAEEYPLEMPQMLRDLGYMTLGIGKMHWHPQNARHGFHATLTDESGRRESPYYISDYHKWFYTQALGLDPEATGLGWNDHGARCYTLPEELHPTAWTGNTAVATIEHYQGEAPLFLKVSFARPHSPYDPPQRLLELYRGVDIPGPAHGDWSRDIGKGVSSEIQPDAPYGDFGDSYAINSRRHYYASITFIDEQIGRIVEALKERDMYDNALICFVSDHGDMLGDHNHWRKTYAYEGSAAIPLILKLPAEMPRTTVPGEWVEAPVELRDLLPTFLAINGIQPPEIMDGKPLTELLCNEKPQWRHWLGLEHSVCYSKDNYWCAITDGKMKYIWFFTRGKEQLFDLECDPYECEDRSTDRHYAERLEKMRDALAEYLAERGTEWVRNGRAVKREQDMLYSPNYPKKKE
ncbi:MAG TPA: arylsulfatase, partial [Candidatus Alistipes intestinipullorum]|nr:arylsulfatase [Candidatus Alistipes intestinipullorum]